MIGEDEKVRGADFGGGGEVHSGVDTNPAAGLALSDDFVMELAFDGF